MMLNRHALRLDFNAFFPIAKQLILLAVFFEGDRAKWKSAEPDGKAKSNWFVLPCQRTSPMVSLHMVGFPGRQIQLKICFASFNYLVFGFA